MRTLVIYDETGIIISQMGGNVREPVGIPFMWVDVPEGKRIIGVDVSVTPNVVIFEDIPISHTGHLQEQVNDLANTIVAISMSGR